MIHSNVKYLVVSVLFIFCAVSMSAQFYISGQSGYSYATNSGQLALVNYNETDEKSSLKTQRGGLGQGINAAFSIGYEVSENYAVELSANYIFNKSTTEEQYNTDFYNSTRTSEISSKILQFSPKLVINIPSTSKFRPYVKIGGTIGVGSIESNNETTSSFDVETRTFNHKTRVNGGVALGLNGGIGGNYMINEKLSIFTEVAILSMSYAPEKFELIEYEVDGVDELSSLSTYDRETIFVDELEYNFNSSNEDEPAQAIKSYAPLSNISLNFGLKFSL